MLNKGIQEFNKREWDRRQDNLRILDRPTPARKAKMSKHKTALDVFEETQEDKLTEDSYWDSL